MANLSRQRQDRNGRRVRIAPRGPYKPTNTWAPLSVRCPRCKAEPSQHCRTPSGKDAAGLHTDRARKARKETRR